MSFLTHLECTRCGETYSADVLRTTCPKDGKPLYPRYDLQAARRAVRREDLEGRAASRWRYRELLPIHDDASVVTLGEGWTPLLRAPQLEREWGLRDLRVKDEGQIVTGS